MIREMKKIALAAALFLAITGSAFAQWANQVGPGAIPGCPLAGCTFTGPVVVSGARFGLSGNISVPAWTTSGVRYVNSAATMTDTTSSGTVAAAYTDVFAGNTIAASSATTFTNYYGAYFNNPVAGTNVTFTNKAALGADSISIGGAAIGPNALAVTGTVKSGNITIPTSGSASSSLSFNGDGRSNITFAVSGFGTQLNSAPGANISVAPGSGVTVFGPSDAASPVAQTLQVQSVVAGTAATAGQLWTLKDSVGTYTGASGGYQWDTAPAAIADTAHNITGVSGTSSPYTITASGSPVYPVGTIITVASATPSSLNGQYTVTSASAGSFVATTAATGTWSSGGTAVINPTAQNPEAKAMGLNSAGHLSWGGLPPVVSACGSTPSGSVDANATDNAGTVTAGGTTASCTITFATAYTTYNHCRVTSQSTLAAFAYTYTKSAITVSATVLGGDLIDYQCDGS